MRGKKQRMPVLIAEGLKCARKEAAEQQLWLAVAEAAQRGLVVCPEAPTLDAALYKLTCTCAASGIGIDDDLRASLALSEAELPVRPTRWRKDGFARGVKPRVGQLMIHIPGKGRISFANWTHDRLFHTVEFLAPKRRAA